jgi:hypothetical protein
MRDCNSWSSEVGEQRLLTGVIAEFCDRPGGWFLCIHNDAIHPCFKRCNARRDIPILYRRGKSRNTRYLYCRTVSAHQRRSRVSQYMVS